MDKWGSPSMPPMPNPEGVSATQQQILLSLWKLKGIGKTIIDEDLLKHDLPTTTPQNDLTEGLQSLQNQGFLETFDKGGRRHFSLTPLGLAILRKIEEDKLQELK